MKYTFIFIFAFLLSACTEKSIEDRALEQLKSTMKEMLTNPDDATLSGVRTVYQTDSLCVIDFTIKAKNGLGMMINQDIEYLYIDKEKMSNPELNGQLEGYYMIGFLGDITYKLEILKKEKEYKKFVDAGFNPEDVLESNVFSVSEKYHDELLNYSNLSPYHPQLKDELIFSAAWLKIEINGREVNNDTKEIKL